MNQIDYQSHFIYSSCVSSNLSYTAIGANLYAK